MTHVAKNSRVTKRSLARALAAATAAGLATLLLSFAASADCSIDACSSVYVERIYVESGANNWIMTSGTETNLTVCSPDSGVFLWLDGSLAQKKEVLALLMMAYSLDKPVYIRVTNGARGCLIAFVWLDR